MTISKKLLLSLLSMDSYNRGYNEGITGLSAENGTPIAGLKVIAASDSDPTSPEVLAGFYAIAYEVTDGSNLDGFSNGDVIISYRGTDSIGELLGTDRRIIVNDNFQEPSFSLAVDFYNSVRAANQELQ